MSRGQQLLELQDIENELRDNIGAYKKIQKKLGGASRIQKARQANKGARSAEKTARIRQQDMNLELQSLSEKISSSEERLYSGKVKNPKELNNLQLEVQLLKKHRENLEEQAILLIDEVDLLSEETAQTKKSYQRIKKIARQRQSQLQKQEKALKRKILELRGTRQEMQTTINAVDLEHYRHAQKQKNDTFVVEKLQEGVCSACHVMVSVSKRDMIERTDKLGTCGNCGRILVAYS
jgi:predicted  nucleic acid-binding Zn-ribbon protein